MLSKRPLVLMGILLVLILGYVTRPWWEPGLSAPKAQPPLPGKNAVSGLSVSKDGKGRWMASLDYFYTGAPAGASVYLDLSPSRPAKASESFVLSSVSGLGLVQRGQHHLVIEIRRPAMPAEAIMTPQVTARLIAANQVLAAQELTQKIEWPDLQTWFFEQDLARTSADELFKRAVAMIDAGDSGSLASAKQVLERLIAGNARFDPGYVELARIAMKSNWGPEGLHQAENLLKSAQQIRPDSVNAKILLAYVYAHQGRYREAEALLAEVAPGNPKNLWLWSNWGELLAMQGKFEPAIQKYREALARPRALDTYDRARLDAYMHLLVLLERKKDAEGMEALHKQRVQEYGAGSCYGADYAQFALIQRGDSANAVLLARQAVEGSCREPKAREVLGMAHYVAWSGATGAQRDELLNQARIFMPAGPHILYLLASSDHTVKAAKQLLATGESIDQQDNEKLNALSYAFQRNDLAAVRRLLRLGAHVDTPVGDGGMPVSLLPVLSSDIEGIRLMQEFGVDYAKVRFQGVTAVEMAKRMGDRKLLRILDPKGDIL